MPSIRTRAPGDLPAPHRTVLPAATARQDLPTSAGRATTCHDDEASGHGPVPLPRSVPGRGGTRRSIIRLAAVHAPALLLVHGLLRLIDGLDGAYGQGLSVDLAHLALSASMVLFGVLAAAVRPLVPAGARPVAALAVAATVAGAAGSFRILLAAGAGSTVLPPGPMLPGPLLFGPLLFALGMLTVLGLLVAGRHAPAWSPLLFGAGIVVILVDVDFLPLAALILLAALAPLARRAGAPLARPAGSARPRFGESGPQPVDPGRRCRPRHAQRQVGVTAPVARGARSGG